MSAGEYELALLGRPAGGQSLVNIEASDVRWVAPGDLDTLDACATLRQLVDHYPIGVRISGQLRAAFSR
jgi:hypothetical protein